MGRRKRKRRKRNKGQLHLQSCCLPLPRSWLEMQAGEAYRNQTSSSKGSYQKTTFRFNVAFQVPLDKTQRKETSVPALSFSGAPLPMTPRQPILRPSPACPPLSSSGEEGNLPLDPLSPSYVFSKDQGLSFLHQWVPPLSPSKLRRPPGHPPGAPSQHEGQAQVGSITGSHLPWGLGPGTRTVSTLLPPPKKAFLPFTVPCPGARRGGR